MLKNCKETENFFQGKFEQNTILITIPIIKNLLLIQVIIFSWFQNFSYREDIEEEGGDQLQEFR